MTKQVKHWKYANLFVFLSLLYYFCQVYCKHAPDTFFYVFSFDCLLENLPFILYPLLFLFVLVVYL